MGLNRPSLANPVVSLSTHQQQQQENRDVFRQQLVQPYMLQHHLHQTSTNEQIGLLSQRSTLSQQHQQQQRPLTLEHSPLFYQQRTSTEQQYDNHIVSQPQHTTPTPEQQQPGLLLLDQQQLTTTLSRNEAPVIQAQAVLLQNQLTNQQHSHIHQLQPPPQPQQRPQMSPNNYVQSLIDNQLDRTLHRSTLYTHPNDRQLYQEAQVRHNSLQQQTLSPTTQRQQTQSLVTQQQHQLQSSSSEISELHLPGSAPRMLRSNHVSQPPHIQQEDQVDLRYYHQMLNENNGRLPQQTPLGLTEQLTQISSRHQTQQQTQTISRQLPPTTMHQQPAFIISDHQH